MLRRGLATFGAEATKLRVCYEFRIPSFLFYIAFLLFLSDFTAPLSALTARALAPILIYVIILLLQPPLSVLLHQLMQPMVVHATHLQLIDVRG